jgi:hypothetical protein
MSTSSSRVHKHFQLDSVKIKRAQKVLRAKTETETETIERAPDLTIAELEKNRLLLDANERFIRSGGEMMPLLSYGSFQTSRFG